MQAVPEMGLEGITKIEVIERIHGVKLTYPWLR
jgi:hypothetical protein